ncbi:hypothetical protein BV22DRAFT_1119255 [Leucogyrophana mollusca]|uniref:Uncharacterized protein n=1 Tax=Leucogyrophana mollusca TaxID=85980 RepID=A0ACB8BLZ5_9AGAM|nr:hypothetical protein BV22DRAFT_1119255 [Leucogyrophana mollusca]
MTSQSHNQAYTILRIKRKRTDEPLDALVVESRVRRKKSRGGVDVFQFAQTVEQDAWEDEQLHQNLQTQISKLAQELPEKSTSKSPAPSEVVNTPAPSLGPQPTDNPSRRYTILPVDGEIEEQGRRKALTSPPKVVSWRDVPPKSDFKMYDAVLAGSTNSPVDTDMENFLPMLQDYLNLQDIPTSTSFANAPTIGLPSDSSTSADYVWDVFYRRPATLNEWTAAANIGTLTGLPPSITDPYDSDSDFEEEDEADEDSNGWYPFPPSLPHIIRVWTFTAEEYYKNDYPEDEGSDDSEGSDMFHEGSDNDDLADDALSDGEHEWR